MPFIRLAKEDLKKAINTLVSQCLKFELGVTYFPEYIVGNGYDNITPIYLSYNIPEDKREFEKTLEKAMEHCNSFGERFQNKSVPELEKLEGQTPEGYTIFLRH
jgi:hypothetical protein